MDSVWLVEEEYSKQYSDGTHVCGAFENEELAKKALRKIIATRKKNFKNSFERLRHIKNAYTCVDEDGFKERHYFTIRKYSLNHIFIS